MTRAGVPTLVADALLERDLQRHVRALARQMGWAEHVAWVSIHSPRGWPDLTLARARPDGVGELVFIEFKRERGRTTDAQDWWLAFLRTVPGVRWCGVVRPSNWMAGVLDEVLR